MVESVRLNPSPASTPETSATMPGRSWPTTVIASSYTLRSLPQPGTPGQTGLAGCRVVGTVAEALIDWFAVHARNLPWRRPDANLPTPDWSSV